MTGSFDLLRVHYLDQPHEVSFESLALCNAACVFCPYPTLTRKGTKLSGVVIQSMIEQMARWPRPFFVSPFKVNEPLLDERLPEICQAIDERVPEATLRLFTNGHPLIERHIEWISRLERLDNLWISLNSTDPQEYGDRMKCSYALVEGKLDVLHEWKKRGDFAHRVVISRVMTGHSVQDYTLFGERASVIGDERDLRFRREVAQRWPLFESFLIKQDAWLGYTKAADPRVPLQPCARWFELNIAATGNVVLCCMDGEEKYVLGNVMSSALLDIYNQPVLRYRRLSAINRIGIDPCEGCSY